MKSLKLNFRGRKFLNILTILLVLLAQRKLLQSSNPSMTRE
ncbi:hypothetical protein SLEP1_g14330 [Rubroshorea leprosula]|uniref:Uncharacterized protein n=1 Tax=Rubroshorea leprosula TaxID=152421 RepID=A0AAV5IT99_9ROSI|nr:hypothetical protein SLEP1_g14330 [Rubroshorea leprosula]